MAPISCAMSAECWSTIAALESTCTKCHTATIISLEVWFQHHARSTQTNTKAKTICRLVRWLLFGAVSRTPAAVDQRLGAQSWYRISRSFSARQQFSISSRGEFNLLCNESSCTTASLRRRWPRGGSCPRLNYIPSINALPRCIRRDGSIRVDHATCTIETKSRDTATVCWSVA